MPHDMEVGLGPGDFVLDGGPAPPGKGAQCPNFQSMSIVAKRSPISATAELLFILILNFLTQTAMILDLIGARRANGGIYTGNPTGCKLIWFSISSASIIPHMPFLPQPSQFTMAWGFGRHRNLPDCITPRLALHKINKKTRLDF